MFVLGTDLLIKGKYTYINLDTAMEPEWFPEYAIDLGGTYYRANPSGGGIVPADGTPPGSMSYAVVTSINLGAHQAAVVLNAMP